jgi:hypothetical protein
MLDAPTGTLLAIGVISVDSPRYAQRRTEQRHAWVESAHARAPLAIARFVMRCGSWAMSSDPAYLNHSYSPSTSMRGENATHRDLHCTNVPANAGRLKGPSLLVLAWFAHAMQAPPWGQSRFVAVADDDAYLHLAPDGLLALLNALPIAPDGSARSQSSAGAEGGTASPLVYVGNIQGWSFNRTTFTFSNFGWYGCAPRSACHGPFPFATGSFMCVSSALAQHVVDATAGAELDALYALSPRHRLFFNDAYLGQTLYRLVPFGRTLPPLHVYNIEPWALDTDGFRVGLHLLLWHNRHKISCRVQCLGDFYTTPIAHALRRGCNATARRVTPNVALGAATGDAAQDASSLGLSLGRIPLNFKWVRTRQKGLIDMERYVLWDALIAGRQPNGQQPLLTERVLRGAAVANLTCDSMVDLRDTHSINALNLTSCRACFDAISSQKAKAHQPAAAARASAYSRVG